MLNSQNKFTKFRDIPAFVRDGNWEADFPLSEVWNFIYKHQEQHQLNIDPDFQRGHVWIEVQQIGWLEFILRGGKTGRVLYLNCPYWNTMSKGKKNYHDFVLVDGKQRLEAIRRFINNEIKVFGSKFNEYTDPIFLMAHNTIRLNVNTLPTKEEVLKWYLQINSGGTPHTQSEIDKVIQMLGKE